MVVECRTRPAAVCSGNGRRGESSGADHRLRAGLRRISVRPRFHLARPRSRCAGLSAARGHRGRADSRLGRPACRSWASAAFLKDDKNLVRASRIFQRRLDAVRRPTTPVRGRKCGARPGPARRRRLPWPRPVAACRDRRYGFFWDEVRVLARRPRPRTTRPDPFCHKYSAHLTTTHDNAFGAQGLGQRIQRPARRCPVLLGVQSAIGSPRQPPRWRGGDQGHDTTALGLGQGGLRPGPGRSPRPSKPWVLNRCKRSGTACG
ncbi:hypothetical protein ABIA39_008682 [Nocardia sp. GAS34]